MRALVGVILFFVVSFFLMWALAALMPAAIRGVIVITEQEKAHIQSAEADS